MAIPTNEREIEFEVLLCSHHINYVVTYSATPIKLSMKARHVPRGLDIACRLCMWSVVGLDNKWSERLTEKEQAILVLIAGGLSNGMIGDKLNLKKSSVAYHVSIIYQKLDLEDIPSKERRSIVVEMFA